MQGNDSISPASPAGRDGRPLSLRLAQILDPYRAKNRLFMLAAFGLAIAITLIRFMTDLPTGTRSFVTTLQLALVAVGLIAGAVLVSPWLVADFGSFRLRRVRAIAGVCFTEALRRRVLWITPLAIVGVVAITQFTRPLDELDAVRQTTKYALFATGLVVVVAAVLLASTSLPKDIESRVIFTIVTKPTTRLEIVLGKVAGFAMVSGLVLLIMGLFTFGYVQTQAWRLESQIRTALNAAKAGSIDLDIAERKRLERYAESGLTITKAVQWPTDLQIYGRQTSADGTRWIAGAQAMFVVVPFAISPAEAAQIQETFKATPAGRFVLTVKAKVEERPASPEEQTELATGRHPRAGDVGIGPSLSGTALVPQIGLLGHTAKTGQQIGKTDLHQAEPYHRADADPTWKSGGVRTFTVPLGLATVDEMLEAGRFNVEVSSPTPTLNFGFDTTPMAIELRSGDSPTPVMKVTSSATESIDVPTPGLAQKLAPPGPRFYSRIGRVGMQIEGRDPAFGDAAVAVFSFAGVKDLEPVNGQVALQTKIAVDRGGDLDADRNTVSRAELVVRNRASGFVSPPIEVEPSTNRVVDVNVPADAVVGGDFDVIIRGLTPGQALGFHGLSSSVPSLALVSAEHAFAYSLAKSLLVLWMLSILVVAMAVFCSTFLSWPIAVVLTIVLLLGRWGVDELGDALSPGASRGMVRDVFRISDAGKSRAVTDSMELLTSILRTGAQVLPDVSSFPVIEDIDRGVSIAPAKMWHAGGVLLLYGVPLILLTYLVLRNKEVAP